MAFLFIRFRPTGLLALAVTALLAAACGGPQKPLPAKAERPVAAPAGKASGRDVPPRPTAETDAAASAGGRTALLAAPPPPPPPPDLSARQFLGQGPDDLVDMLGEPRLIRRDYPAEIWQYVRPGCVLLVFLYESAADPLRVWYLEMHDGSVALASLSTVAQKTCLRELYKDSRPTSS